MIVCICHFVRSQDIEKCIEDGCDLEGIQKRTRACTSCMRCRDVIEDLLQKGTSDARLSSEDDGTR